MFVKFLTRFLTPNIFTFLFYKVFPLFLFVRYLFTRPFGLLLLTISLYIFSSFFSDSRPYSLAELVLWFDALDSGFKTGVTTALLTIIGFLITFHAATSSWKGEALAKLRIEAASDIEIFFNEAAVLSTDLSIFAKGLIDAVEGYRTLGETQETIFYLRNVIDKTPKYISTRDRLSAMSVEAHRFGGRYSAVINALPLGRQYLDKSVGSLSRITGKIWLTFPIIAAGNEISAQIFVDLVDLKSCRDYIDIYEAEFPRMNGNHGGLRGMLLYSVTGFNFSMIRSVKDKEIMKKGMEVTLFDNKN